MSLGQLPDLVVGTVETMNDPSLCRLMFFMQTKDVGGATDVMDDQRFLILLGKQDMFLEIFDLKVERFLMDTVDTRLADGGYFVVF